MTEARHNCGLCSAYTLEDTLSILADLSHRGREVWGIGAVGSHGIDTIKVKGEVGRRIDLQALIEIFSRLNPLGLDDYRFFFGHNRYGTRGKSDLLREGHPHVIGGREIRAGDDYVVNTGAAAALVHNGQANNLSLSDEESAGLKSDCDSEALLHLYRAKSERDIMNEIPCFGTAIIADSRRDELIVMRDATGIKPGVMGRKRTKIVTASEDIALKKNGIVEGIDDLTPGTIYYFSKDGSVREEEVQAPNLRHCMFEWNYIGNVDSVINGIQVRRLRRELGIQQARENPLAVSLVTFVPRCPEVSAEAYAKELGICYGKILHKPHRERSFQGPNEDERRRSIGGNLYLLPNVGELLYNAEIAVHEDSLVRGNNIAHALILLERARVRKVHVLSYTPMIGILDSERERTGCKWGVDMPPTDSFIALNISGTGNATRTAEGIAEELKQRAGLSSMEVEIHYLSIEGMMQAYRRAGSHNPERNLCYRCIGGPKPDVAAALTISAT